MTVLDSHPLRRGRLLWAEHPSERRQNENHDRLLGLRVDRVWAKLSTPAMFATSATQNELARRLLWKLSQYMVTLDCFYRQRALEA